MLHQNTNTDLTLLRSLILKVLDQLEAERVLCEQQFEMLTKRLNSMEQREQNRVERLESLEAEIPYLRHRMGRSIELEYLENPYSLDGEPRCNW